MLIQGPKFPTPISCLFSIEKRANYSPFFPKLMGSRTHLSKIDGFPGTHWTHANGATGSSYFFVGKPIWALEFLNLNQAFKKI